MNKYFERLSIEPCLEHNEEKNKHLAREIKNIINTLYVPLAVVKPCSLNTLLYIGIPLFLKCTNFYNNESRYTLLGYINDTFESVAEPMYSVSVKLNSTIDILNINEKVYYFRNYPNTSRMYIEHTIDKMSNKRRYNIKIKNL